MRYSEKTLEDKFKNAYNRKCGLSIVRKHKEKK